MIRVLLVEDHAVVRAGLERLLGAAGDLDVVDCARDGDEALDLVRTHEPDVVLMDLSMPKLDGAAATRQITAAHPDVRVVILTSFSDRERILGALDAGAVGYVLKDADPDELASAIRAAARGESPLDPKAAHAVLTARRRPAAAQLLTGREREVLQMVGEGMPNKHISRRLGISEKTVKAHLTSIFRTLGVTDRTQAALWAQRNGLTATPPKRR